MMQSRSNTINSLNLTSALPLTPLFTAARHLKRVHMMAASIKANTKALFAPSARCARLVRTGVD